MEKDEPKPPHISSFFAWALIGLLPAELLLARLAVQNDWPAGKWILFVYPITVLLLCIPTFVRVIQFDLQRRRRKDPMKK